MNSRMPAVSRRHLFLIAVMVLGIIAGIAGTQDRLPQYPGYAQYQRMSKEIGGSVVMGSLAVTWKDGGKTFDYQWKGKTYHYNIAARKATEEPSAAPQTAARGGVAGGVFGTARGAGRGRGESFARAGQQMGGGGIARQQTTSAQSPDRKHNAFSRGGNLWLSDPDGGNEKAITTDGNEKARIRYGIATIIYGEELGMVGGIFWSADSKKLAYYRFDESQVPDYYVTRNQTRQYDTLEIDAYPKAGVRSPVVDLFIYDLNTGKSVTIDVRDGKPFEDSTVGYYVYRIYWSPDGKELLFHRMNRKQNILEFAAADPETGRCRVVVREEWLPSWVDWAPTVYFFKDGRRFLWTSERTGFKNYYLYDLSGKLLATLTNHPFEVANIARVDEESGLLYYMARDGDNHMKLQLHRVGLTGQGDKRLTDPAFNHSVDFSPDGRYFIDVTQTHDAPPFTRLLDSAGKVVAELAKSDMTKFDELGLKRVELLKFKAADGKTDLYGLLNFPSNFDPKKTYPLLVSVYAGPLTNAARETFSVPNSLTEYGFLVATFDSRSAAGRGKRFVDAIYGHLGIVEMNDQAAGVRLLWDRPYVDKTRVGIFGTSYGGTASATCLMRFPDIFQAACSSSPVTDYRNYNNIYGERYMGLVEENQAGYDAAAIMTYIENLKGRLMLFYGTADNNVHPSSTMQLIQALQKAGKSFEVQVGPDLGHSGINQARMMEFFIENLVLKWAPTPEK
jgi:dipeptidyl-peptidase-4